jgi:Skp family chaperone for outer membrane proteins
VDRNMLRSRSREIILRILIAFLCAAGTLCAQPPKVALVNIQQAIVATTDGREAEKKLDAQFSPRKATLDAAQNEISALAAKLKQEGLPEEDRARINQQMEEKASALDQETEKADADLKAAQDDMLKQLGPKMVATIAQYAKDHGYAVVFDTSSSDVPRLYAPNATDITNEVAAAYEKSRRR